MRESSRPGQTREMDDALRVFGDAVAQYDGDASTLELLREPLRQFCLQAKREQLAPEQVLIFIKRVVERLPVSRVPGATTESSARTRLIAYAIKTYYADAE